jgi:hypothetical protein
MKTGGNENTFLHILAINKNENAKCLIYLKIFEQNGNFQFGFRQKFILWPNFNDVGGSVQKFKFLRAFWHFLEVNF